MRHIVVAASWSAHRRVKEMSDKTAYRLGDSTLIEPLVNKWWAWSHLISPVASSFHLQNYQRKILTSFLNDPKAHVRVCRDPKYRSGRFVDLPENKTAAVREFLAQTEMKLAANLRLAKSTVEFQNHLVEAACGETLDPFYGQLPQELRGYVELVYDYYNRPTTRFFEALLYESEYYQKDLQSLRLFEYTHDTVRPFFMNTPRLQNENQIEWIIPFESHQIDELFMMETRPRPLGQIRELLGLGPASDPFLLTLLSEEPAPACPRWEGEVPRIRYFGHACVLVEWAGQAILTDPCIGVIPSQRGPSRLSYRDLPDKIDYAIVTHAHHDHFVVETLLRLRHRIECLVVPRSFGIYYGDVSLRLMARKIGFKRVIEVDTLESIPLTRGAITAIPFMGEHADLAHGKTAYVVRAEKEQMFFAADSDCLDAAMYSHVYDILGPIDTVFIGMECVGAPLSWTCGVFLPVQPKMRVDLTRRYKGADSSRALSILDAVKAKRLFIYAMGLEPWMEFMLGLAYSQDAVQLREAASLIQKARARGLSIAELLNATVELQPASSSSSSDRLVSASPATLVR
jgi:L-ascorbate metabolism protein UlaG (beta-lactamase superfamily)